MKHHSQTTPRTFHPLQLLAAASVLVTAGFTAGAQEPEEEDTGRLEQLESELNQQDPKQQEMMDLFAEVERNLLAIDDLLFEAAAGEQDLELLESGISELFLASRDRSREVAEGIDAILDLAQEMQQEQQQQQQGSGSPPDSSQGGEQGQEQGQGSSPMDNRGQESQREMESSRNEAGSPQSGQDTGGNSETEGSDPQQGERPTPEGGEQGEGEGANQEGEQVGSDPLGAGSEAGAAGQWGELPPRVQEIFSNQVSDDLPLEYREFIEAYWLRLQREG